MNFLKNILIGIFFLYAMYWGGMGTQSDGTFAQGLGFISIIMAFGSLYVLYKLIPKVLSSTTTALIIVAIILYSAYCLGFFNGKSVSEFLTGQTPETAETYEDEYQVSSDEDDVVEEVAQDIFDNSKNMEEPSQKNSNNGSGLKKIKPQNLRRKQNTHRMNGETPKNTGLVGKLKTFLIGENQNASSQPSIADINPYDYPSITGPARVISGSIIQLEGLTVKLFGVAAPNLQQTCADKHGAGYYCGKASAIWLQNWLNGKDVTCYILGQVVRGRATGACFTENNKYDIAAAVVSAGWAVAYTKNTQIYVPYEEQAAQNRKGLWQGEFYKPWDWEKIQNRKVDIQIHVPEPQAPSSKGWGVDWNSLKGLF